MTPRPYQVPGIEKAVRALPKHGAYLLADETGCGKSYSAAFTAKRLGWPVAVVCPKAVIPSWRGVLTALNVPTVFVENIERLRARKEWLRKEGKKWVWNIPRCLLVFDECFVPGTNVLTPTGEVPIESLRVGDLVVTPYGAKKVTRTIKSEGHFKIVSCTNNERSVVCTPNHKFYDGTSFTPVSQMRSPAWSAGKNILLRDVRLLGETNARSDSCPSTKITGALGGPRKSSQAYRGPTGVPSEKRTLRDSLRAVWGKIRFANAKAFLLALLRYSVGGETTSRCRSSPGSNEKAPSRPGIETPFRSYGKDDQLEPREAPSSPRESVRCAAREASPALEWRERAWTYCATDAHVRNTISARLRYGDRPAAGERQQKPLAGGFEIRFSTQGGEAGHRNRRTIAQHICCSGKGQEENEHCRGAGLESSATSEYRGNRQPRPLYGDHTVTPISVKSCGVANTVYDLEVEDAHCYYANGFLVSNCHRFGSPDSQSAHILNAAPKPVLMLSATVADSPLKLRAIGSQLGLTTWNGWWSWCLKNGCKPAFFGGLEFKNPAKLAALHEAIFTEKGSRVRKKDLPPGEFPEEQIELVPVPVEDPAKINAEYAELLASLQAESPNAAVFNLRARQLSELQKLPAIESMIADLLEEGNSVCVFLNFSNSLEHLHTKFPDASLVFGTNTKGQTQSAEDRQAQIEKFQSNESRLILCMTSAGGIGISLHDLHGEHPRVSLINPNHSAVELIQALGRIHRNGAKTPCIQRLIFAADTIEEQVMKKVQKKVGNISLLSDGDLSPLSTSTTP